MVSHFQVLSFLSMFCDKRKAIWRLVSSGDSVLASCMKLAQTAIPVSQVLVCVHFSSASCYFLQMELVTAIYGQGNFFVTVTNSCDRSKRTHSKDVISNKLEMWRLMYPTLSCPSHIVFFCVEDTPHFSNPDLRKPYFKHETLFFLFF